MSDHSHALALLAHEERAKVQAHLAAIEEALSAQHGDEEVTLP